MTSRRHVLQRLLLPAAISSPALWTTPLISTVVLPAHAMTTRSPTGFIMMPEVRFDTRKCEDGINQSVTANYEFLLAQPGTILTLDSVTFPDPDIIVLVPGANQFPLTFESGQTFTLQIGRAEDCATAVQFGIFGPELDDAIYHFRGFPPGKSYEFPFP